jgi:hypothetical protein
MLCNFGCQDSVVILLSKGDETVDTEIFFTFWMTDDLSPYNAKWEKKI